VPVYLETVRQLHRLRPAQMARALGVSSSVLRRWRRGTLIPPSRRLREMTALWGGDVLELALGAALQRWARTTGLTPADAVAVLVQRRRESAAPRKGRRGDRAQLPLPIAR
jgi:transcriptional regulator with XRE-family HTH domain